MLDGSGVKWKFGGIHLILIVYMILYERRVLYNQTRLKWGFKPISLKSYIKFDTRKEHWKLSVLESKQYCSKWEIALKENLVNIEIKRLELTI